MRIESVIKNAYIGIGSNMGNRHKNCEMAVRLLQAFPSISVVSVSSFHETEALTLPGEKHASYINGAVHIQTDLTPHELLRVCKNIELKMGRKRTMRRWQSRPIDLDILLYQDVQLKSEKLTIPHPEMSRRDFVLVPLMEIILPKDAIGVIGNL